MNLLRRILRDKRQEVKRQKKSLPMKVLREAVAGLPDRPGFRFAWALKKARGVAVIAEIKRKSPSKGILCRSFNPERLAREYQRSGASALSVLTDRKYFGGSPAALKRVRRSSSLPILRKDFIVDEYQIFEARLWGADAVLLIASALSTGQMRRFKKTADSLGLDALFEVHSEKELKRVLPLKPRLIGVNNRDLKTFSVSLEVTERLSRLIPRKTLFVSESGITQPEHIIRARRAGAKAVLVGEALVREKKPGLVLKKLIGLSCGSR